MRPVTRDNFDDFAALFEARGGPHYCWCTPYRFRDVGSMSNAQKKGRMQDLVARSVPIGVLAFDGDTPVGWCSIAPRETYVRLEKSRTMPRATPVETPTWVVLCFFVHRDRRGKGITRALLSGAVDYAREQGAEVIEGYPADTAGISSIHRGHSGVFKAAGFRMDGKRWFLTL